MLSVTQADRRGVSLNLISFLADNSGQLIGYCHSKLTFHCRMHKICFDSCILRQHPESILSLRQAHLEIVVQHCAMPELARNY